MAPTIIVGDDENAGDVAGELLAAADNQRQVRVRTDLPRPAFEVPDDLYKKYVGSRTRPDDEQRVNAVDELPADDEPLVSDDLPDAARNVEPGTGDVDQLAGDLVSEELPDAARNVEPPSNGDAPDDGSGNPDPDADADVEAEQAPKPRKRAPSRRAATKSTPAAAGPNK